MSSAEMASTTPCESRLMSTDWRKLARMPVTTISSSGAGSALGGVAGASESPGWPTVVAASCAKAAPGAAVIAIAETPRTRREAARAKLRIDDLPVHTRRNLSALEIVNVHIAKLARAVNGIAVVAGQQFRPTCVNVNMN